MCAAFVNAYNVSRFSLPISPALPHRTSLLTGRHPGTTHIWDLYSYFRTIPGLANATTFPQYFKDRGYHTYGMGKPVAILQRTFLD